uniref:(northern house mosquito) hypothetical protein n=1 Tax=Culex pipiens TaxID=7175 RepID=A0A8D8BVM0_CULPI
MSDFGTARRSFRIEKLTRLASWKSDIYPPEIWEHIFSYLTGLQLLRARLVCRRWRDIITGCPSLMRKLRIRLDNRELNSAIDGSYNPTGLPPVADLIIQDYLIIGVGSWWPRVGQKLTHLTLSGGTAEISLLFGMLQQTSNLRSLQIREFCLLGTANPNVQLNRLQELKLDHVIYPIYHFNKNYTNLLDIFDKIFPRVKDLRIRKIWKEDFSVDRLLPSIRALAGTLEALEVDDAAVNVLRDLPELTRLRRISLHIEPRFSWDKWARFFRTQRLIEDLVIYTDELSDTKVLRDIGRAVPNLKRLTLHVVDEIDTEFLQFMPKLEYFDLRGDLYHNVGLYRMGSPRIKELHLRDVDVSGFWRYLNRSPQLESIVLICCSPNDGVATAKVFKNVRFLEISLQSIVSDDMLKALFRKCPLLETLIYGCDEDTCNDSVVLLACKRLKHLRKLSLLYCPVSDGCVEHIVRHGLALEEVRFSRNKLSEGAVERLRATRNIRVVVDKDE